MITGVVFYNGQRKTKLWKNYSLLIILDFFSINQFFATAVFVLIMFLKFSIMSLYLWLVQNIFFLYCGLDGLENEWMDHSALTFISRRKYMSLKNKIIKICFIIGTIFYFIYFILSYIQCVCVCVCACIYRYIAHSSKCFYLVDLLP